MHKRHEIKKIGFYDSGLGGLFVMQRVQKKFPNYEYVFLADEKNLPYGDKSVEDLLVFARSCITHLIEVDNCDVIVIACNTLSATVYESLADEFKASHPHVLLLDVISPTLDFLEEDTHFSVFGTPRTIESHMYKNGIIERFPDARVDEYSTLELASMIERHEDPTAYITDLHTKVHAENHTIILGCTHYGVILDIFRKIFEKSYIVTQDEIVLDMLCFILHASDGAGAVSVYVTKESPVFASYTKDWFPDTIPQLVVVD
jgi:glutamate racemase